jgi:hypothetical protein
MKNLTSYLNESGHVFNEYGLNKLDTIFDSASAAKDGETFGQDKNGKTFKDLVRLQAVLDKYNLKRDGIDAVAYGVHKIDCMKFTDRRDNIEDRLGMLIYVDMENNEFRILGCTDYDMNFRRYSVHWSEGVKIGPAEHEGTMMHDGVSALLPAVRKALSDTMKQLKDEKERYAKGKNR